tara:strand:- start:7936 stop:8097 length:162 start_codon:yes stop_codon:yes gene_type:complete
MSAYLEPYEKLLEEHTLLLRIKLSAESYLRGFTYAEKELPNLIKEHNEKYNKA